MGFKVSYKGTEIHCETAEEAVLLVRLLGEKNGHPVPASAGKRGDPNMEVGRYRALVGLLNSDQRKFLKALVDNPYPQTDASLRQEIGIEGNKALGGMLSGISKSAKKLGIEIDTVWTSERKKIGDGLMREFRVAPEFRDIAGEIGL